MENVPWLDPISARVFVTTRWTVIAACRQSDHAKAQTAVAELCQAYWQPVYVCIRHHGYSVHDAQDLTQDFFVRLLRGAWLEHLDAAKGRFRSYLLVALRNFLCDRWRRRWTFRRGRGYDMISFDTDEAEGAYRAVPSVHTSPESLYERQWARAVIDHTLEQLRIELRADGKEILFEHFDGDPTASTQTFSYPEIAQSLGLTAGGLRACLYRWRQRFQALMRAEIARTVTSKSDIEDELQHLHRVFARAD